MINLTKDKRFMKLVKKAKTLPERAMGHVKDAERDLVLFHPWRKQILDDLEMVLNSYEESLD